MPSLLKAIRHYVHKFSQSVLPTSRRKGCSATRYRAPLRIWRALPGKIRKGIFYRIVLPGVRKMLASISREKRDQLFQEEIVLSSEILGLEGWHNLQFEGEKAFRWSRTVSSLFVNPQVKTGFLEMRLGYPEHVAPPKLIIEGWSSHEIAIRGGWHTYIVPVAAMLNGCPKLTMRVEPARKLAEDSRERGVMASAIRIVPQDLVPDEVARCTQSVAQNLLSNDREWRQGKVELTSFPPHLRLDLETRCNIKPRCIYCAFDSVKEWRTGRIIDSTRPSWVRWGLFSRMPKPFLIVVSASRS